MELMTKYQYTYFIYPYMIEEEKYKKYLQGLLRNKKCKLRIFDKQKDIHLYTYFLPNIREYMFWSFDTNRQGIKDFNKLDTSVKATLLAERDCNVFNYELEENLQGKVDDNNCIFFEITGIKIICFKTGVCFLVFKTNLENSENFSDILNFNYKFREVNSIAYNLKEYENIKIQSSSFKNVKDITTLIKEITYQYVFKKMFRGNIHIFKFFTPEFLYKHMIKGQYDVVVSYLEGPTTRIISGCPNDAKIINWVHTSPTDANVLLKSYRNRTEFVSCMRKYDSTVFVAESAKNQFVSVFQELQKLDMDVIYNPINNQEIRYKAKQLTDCIFPDDTFNIVAVGRLSKVKGFERLVRICIKLKQQYNIRLYIIGKGEEAVALRKLIKEYQADSYISLLGYRENPYPLVAQASLFVCSSYREGYSTSVIEALVLGVPVVTTLCSGMEEILGSKSQYGMLVENSEDGIYQGIAQMVSKRSVYEYYRRKAIERGETFSLNKGIDAVKKHFNKICGNGITK